VVFKYEKNESVNWFNWETIDKNQKNVLYFIMFEVDSKIDRGYIWVVQLPIYLLLWYN